MVTLKPAPPLSHPHSGEEARSRQAGNKHQAVVVEGVGAPGQWPVSLRRRASAAPLSSVVRTWPGVVAARGQKAHSTTAQLPVLTQWVGLEWRPWLLAQLSASYA